MSRGKDYHNTYLVYYFNTKLAKGQVFYSNTVAVLQIGGLPPSRGRRPLLADHWLFDLVGK